MRRNNIIALIATLFICYNLYSQDKGFYEKSFPAFTNYFHENYGIICKEPANVSNLNIYNTIWIVRKGASERSTATLLGPILQSNDKDCLFAYPCTNIRFFPINQINAEVASGIGAFDRHGYFIDTSKFDCYDYATVITDKKAREMFNADTLYIYDIPNADSSYFLNKELEKMQKENYPYCTGVVICKKGRIAMEMKLFFTEKGKIKEDEYINMLNKQIWYTDTFDKTRFYNKSYIITFQDSNNSMHAVNLVWVANDKSLLTIDPSKSDIYGIIFPTDSCEIYKLN